MMKAKGTGGLCRPLNRRKRPGKEIPMAKDDYHVIVYKILLYLYTQLKKGEPVDRTKLSHDSKALQIPKKYWEFILENMQREGLIRGLDPEKAAKKENYIDEQLENIQITVKGIDMLADNASIEKVNRLLQNVVKQIPGL